MLNPSLPLTTTRPALYPFLPELFNVIRAIFPVAVSPPVSVIRAPSVKYTSFLLESTLTTVDPDILKTASAVAICIAPPLVVASLPVTVVFLSVSSLLL